MLKFIANSFLVLITHNIYISATAQRTLPNCKINNREVELLIFGGLNERGITFGGLVDYRFPLKKGWKAGVAVSLEYEDQHGNLLTVVAGDILKLFGSRQKWSLAGNLGYGFYKYEHMYSTASYNKLYQEKGGLTFLIRANRRAIISKNLQLTTGIYFSHQTFSFHDQTTYYQPVNTTVSRGKNSVQGGGISVGVIL